MPFLFVGSGDGFPHLPYDGGINFSYTTLLWNNMILYDAYDVELHHPRFSSNVVMAMLISLGRGCDHPHLSNGGGSN